jgi:hypothetical protein
VGPFRQGKPLVLPTPELDAYEAELRARAHRKVLYTVAGCVVLVAPLVVLFLMATVPEVLSKVKHPLRGVSPQAADTARASVARAREAARVAEAAAREGVERAVEQGLDAHPELGRCPTADLPPDAETSLRRLTDPHVCAACDAKASEASLLEGSLKERSRDAGLDARVVQRARRLARAVESGGAFIVMHVTAEAPPHGVPGAGFTPGQVRGRAYLWEPRSRQVLCVGDFQAESSESVDYKVLTRGPLGPLGQAGSAELQHALAQDLAARTRAAARESLRYRAGPHIVD